MNKIKEIQGLAKYWVHLKAFLWAWKMKRHPLTTFQYLQNFYLSNVFTNLSNIVLEKSAVPFVE